MLPISTVPLPTDPGGPDFADPETEHWKELNIFEDTRPILLFFAVLKWSLAILRNVLELEEWTNM
jgi:hypothetical protein